MDDVLLDLVLARLERVPLRDEAAALLLAAREGDARLAALLTGAATPRAERWQPGTK